MARPDSIVKENRGMPPKNRRGSPATSQQTHGRELMQEASQVPMQMPER
ncbi:hypothetical protein CA13_29950 [Planctomycetes bacterium CA13]|uniref:Uncharacterized protein n=1 Tax=Novipirellula herctigrandis TaxID=2527986 RepID=A0A5C5Z2D4_9BACT|nr:hypothetical protein CA13_29950 [Planctomycetes bacterium CA13]